jgi:hypothetical protein
MTTTVTKNHYGDWCAESEFPLEGNRVIQFTTVKRSNKKLETTAKVVEIDGNFYKYVMFQDFSQRVSSAALNRITEKAVREQHHAALMQFESVKQAAIQHYAAKEKL